MVLGASWYVAFCSLDFPSFQKKDIQDHPHGKEMQKSKIAVRGELTNSCGKKRGEKQRRKGKIYPFESGLPKNSKER